MHFLDDLTPFKHKKTALLVGVFFLVDYHDRVKGEGGPGGTLISKFIHFLDDLTPFMPSFFSQ